MSTVLNLFPLHHESRAFMFASRIRMRFRTTRLKYPCLYKLRWTVLFETIESLFSLNKAVMSDNFLFLFSFTNLKSLRLSLSLNFACFPFRRLFSTLPRLPYRSIIDEIVGLGISNLRAISECFNPDRYKETITSFNSVLNSRRTAAMLFTRENHSRRKYYWYVIMTRDSHVNTC